MQRFLIGRSSELCEGFAQRNRSKLKLLGQVFDSSGQPSVTIIYAVSGWELNMIQPSNHRIQRNGRLTGGRPGFLCRLRIWYV